VAPPRFGLACLRLKGVGCDGNKALLAAVNNAGQHNQFVLSSSTCCSWRCRVAHVGASITTTWTLP
jgi:hypothetical protein